MKQTGSRESPGHSWGEAPSYRVQVLERAFAILNALADGNSYLASAEISKRLHLNKTTTHRLLSVLGNYGYVERNGARGEYSLGSRLFELGSKAVSRLDLVQYARPFLRRLVAETGETSHLAVLRRGEVISMAIVESPRTLRMPATAGGRSPVHCTSIGKAILAFHPEAETDEIIRTQGLRKYTEKTITSPAAFKSELRRVRERGYAIDEQEFEIGLRCVGAPVRNYTGKVIGSVSVAGPSVRLGQDRMPVLIRSVVKAAGDLSAALGYRETNGKQG